MKIDIIDFITTIRSSFCSSIAIYTQGNCYQFYEILKVVFPNAEPYFDGNHVWTKIDNDFYDITGKIDNNIKLYPIIDKELIESLCSNKWSDERRLEYNKLYVEILKNKKNPKIKNLKNEKGKLGNR